MTVLHEGVGANSAPLVTPAEILAGTSTALRSYRVVDVVDIAQTHASGGGGGGGDFTISGRSDSSTETLTNTHLDTVTSATLSTTITKTLPLLGAANNGHFIGFHVQGLTASNTMTVVCAGGNQIEYQGALVTSVVLSNLRDFLLLLFDTTNGVFKVITDSILGDNAPLRTGDIGTSVQAHDPTALNAADIGSSVQAHSAVLDATTASFTAAQAAIVAAALVDADIGSSVQGHSAVLDATTASFTAALLSKLNGIESGATADQTGAEIETAYNAQVSVMPQAEAEARTATTSRRINALRIGQAIVAALAGGPTINDGQYDGQQTSSLGTITGDAIQCDTGTVFARTQAGAFTPTVANVPAGVFYQFRLILTYTSGVTTWTSFTGLDWDGGAVPTFTAGRRYHLDFSTTDGGTTWDGCVAKEVF